MSTDDDNKQLFKRLSAGFMTSTPSDQPALRPEPDAQSAPNIAIELGPRMTGLVNRAPLDDEAAEQIKTVLNDPTVAELRKPLVAVILLNCIERRVADYNAGLAELDALKDAIEKAAKSG